jgi:hypothetical protein
VGGSGSVWVAETKNGTIPAYRLHFGH